jgi:hypothetical protein
VQRSTAPERGLGGEPTAADLFAFGVVLATAAIALIDFRFQGRWADEAQLALTGTAFVLTYGLAARGGRPAEPPASRSALFLASLVLLALTLGHLTEVVLGERDPFGGTSVAWASAAFLLAAAATGIVFRSAACTFVAAAAAGVLTIAFVATVLEPDGENAYKWAIAAYFVVLCAAGYAARLLGDSRHSPQLLAAPAIALILTTYGFGFFFVFGEEGDYGVRVGRPFEALLVAGPLLVLGFGLFFRERGPSWAGAVALATGLSAVGGSKPTLLVWPLALLGAAAALMLAAAVRARTARG